jgi:predicted GNAT superfamily acetyltransferase
VVHLDVAVAVQHAGGYVAGAFVDDAIVGASLGFLARHHGHTALHSHITGLLDGFRHGGIGRRMKLHQREWALDHDIHTITWTFDPLVRRNAWFNIAVLGADAEDYLPEFYGTMTDSINAGDESDRLLMRWDLDAAPLTVPREGSEHVNDPDVTLVPTPVDIVELRRTDPEAVADWRSRTRDALTAALAARRPVVGFTRSGDYVIGSAT